MPEYTVRVREIHEAFYTIKAENPEDALMNVAEKGALIDNSAEFVMLDDPQFWAVTDKDDSPIPPVTFDEPIIEWLMEKFPDKNGHDNPELTAALGNLILDLAKEEISNTNNGGIVDQVRYIIWTCGTEARKVIQDALGEEV